MPGTPDLIQESLLQYMQIAVLERLAPMNYQVIGQPPTFYIRMFPSEKENQPCSSPWAYSFMLEDFLGLAETFFESGETQAIDTGFWIEDSLGAPGALQAMAIKLHDKNLLIIRCAHEDHIEKSRMLNKARKGLIERRHLTNELTFFRTKSSTDPLTTLYNRSMFMDFLESILDQADKRQRNISLLMFDIDNFKLINDKHGHLKGDAVLAELGTLVKNCVRDNDMAVRYGGEEFCVLSQDITQDQAMLFANKLLSSIATHDFDLEQQLTVSIGVTMHKPGDTPLQLIERADACLYEAKRNGKNQVCLRN